MTWGVQVEDTIFSLRYEGTGISDGLEPIAFSEAVRGFAEFVSSITEQQFGTPEDVTLKVHRLSQGSLVLDLLQRIGEVSINDLVAVSATVGKEIADAIRLLKHLQGKPPAAVERSTDNRVAVQNNNGAVTVFNNSTVNLVINGDLGGTLERVAKPVSQGGATGFAVEVNSTAVASVNREEIASMVSVATDKALLENESEIWLTAVKVVLEGEAMWTFTDGRRPFSAPVLDPEFLESVKAGRERFGKGDRLLVRLKARQSQRGNRLRTQYEVTQVFRHERGNAADQANLF